MRPDSLPAALRLIVALMVLVSIFASAAPGATASPARPPWQQQSPFSTETATVWVGEQAVNAEIADTTPLRSRGLGFRDSLAEGAGMLFVFESPAERTFWMKGMRFCLDILWIEAGRLVGAFENACPEPGVSDQDIQRYRSGVPVQYVLEVPAGWLKSQGQAVGSPVEMLLPGGDSSS